MGVGSWVARGKFFATAYCLLSTVYFLSGCGKIGDPIPPTPRAPLIVQELQVAQQGTELILSFPLKVARSSKPQRIDVYRLVESASDPQGVTVESFSARASLITSIDQIPEKNSTINYRDALDLKSTTRNQRYRYAVRLVNQVGQAADFSNYAVIAPLFDLALPPVDLKIAQQEKQIDLSWSAPAANESGTTPANVAAYNLYRRTGDSVVKLNAQPLTETRFTDRNFAFGTGYQYTVRALSLLPGSPSLTTAIESNESASFAHTPKDTFPPVAPNPVTIASIGGIVSLFWPLNQETDVAGYNIYRAESAQTPPAQWIKLTAQLHKTASFRDDRVQVGKQYFYQIAAVDVYGNESARSLPVNETVNP
ncbi:MAG: hypothetical protein KA368_06010 [Acidobacteria bacterium]|nr:hypothetical protein [Acidobacteriota bacterium]